MVSPQYHCCSSVRFSLQVGSSGRSSSCYMEKEFYWELHELKQGFRRVAYRPPTLVEELLREGFQCVGVLTLTNAFMLATLSCFLTVEVR